MQALTTLGVGALTVSASIAVLYLLFQFAAWIIDPNPRSLAFRAGFWVLLFLFISYCVGWSVLNDVA